MEYGNIYICLFLQVVLCYFLFYNIYPLYASIYIYTPRQPLLPYHLSSPFPHHALSRLPLRLPLLSIFVNYQEISLSFFDISTYCHWVYKYINNENTGRYFTLALIKLLQNDYGLYVMQGLAAECG